MASELFDELADAYEAMIDWPRRLANEEPFYRGLLERLQARKVLDVACGTGHHAAMFHSWGMQVEGADLSVDMIRRCRENFGESSSLRWSVRGFDQPVGAGGPYDLAICIGNSLALAADVRVMAGAVSQMLGSVRAGGAIVIQVLNLWRLTEGSCQWQKCQRTTLPQGQSLIIKGVRRVGVRGYVDVLVVALAEDPPVLRSQCVPFWGLEAAQLDRLARDGGATQVEIYGDYQQQVYQRQQSQDLLLLAFK